MELKVHDLIRIQSICDIQCESLVPEWVYEAVKQSPWVVVRRSAIQNGLIPIGVRGIGRNQRFAAYVPIRNVVECLTPVQLAAQARERLLYSGMRSHIYFVLEEMIRFYGGLGIPCGPTGSVGFELASGAAVVHSGSDMDWVIYATEHVERQTAAQWNAFHMKHSIRVDALLETPHGACSLTEYVQSDFGMLLRTGSGPILVGCPWKLDV